MIVSLILAAVLFAVSWLMIFSVVTQLQETHNRGEQLDVIVAQLQSLEEICQRAEQAAKQSKDCGLDRPINNFKEPNER